MSEQTLQLGTYGETDPCLRRGLPDHIDGIPVPDMVPSLTLPRRFDLVPRPLPMMEIREDDDAGQIAARWPEPLPEHDLGEAT